MGPIILKFCHLSIISTLQGLGEAKFTMKITFYGVILKTLVLAIFSFFRIGIYGLIVSEIVNIIFVVGTNLNKIKKVMASFPC